jgi:hypothetical protein
MTARYRETSACPPGRCFESEAVGATGYSCAGECLVALSMAGRFIADVPAPELFGEGLPAAVADIEPDDGSDIELAPESWAQLTCPDWTL